jgi:hypothetical protein
MAKTTYTVTTAEGKVETRKSERPYTHVLLGRVDYVAERAFAHTQEKFHHETFNWYSRVASGNYNFGPYTSAEEVARKQAHARAQIAGHTPATFAAKLIAGYIAKHAPEGEVAGPEVALRWSASQANATKAITEFQARHYTGLRVVPALPKGGK